MPTLKSLTDAAAQRLKPRAGQAQTDFFDGQFPGLVLRVSERRKTWNHVFRFNGKQRRDHLGLFPAVSVAVAHEAWRAARADLQAGRDPARNMATPSTTFVKVFEEWMQRDQADNKSAGKVRRIFAREVLPYWQNRDIGEITRRDVLDVVDRIVDRGALGAARKAHASLHRLFQWALGRGIVATSPTAALPKPGSDVSRDRVLADAEIVQVWPAAPELGLYGVAVQLLLLTGARREEISRLRHDEIRDGAIHLSGAKTKSGEARIIPLSKPAQALVAGLPESFELKLTGWGHQKAKLDKLVQIPPWRLHDLRRTCATGLQKLGVRLEVTEAILGHTSGSRSGIVGVYQRHNFADEKRIALEAWGAHVMALVEGSTPGKVVAFRGK